MNKPIIFNIVSGKGGTGKSLFCAILGRLLAQEGAKVLLVDFDLFVRGLTYFFYIFKKEKREITQDITVADYFEISSKETNSKTGFNLAKERFYEVDLIPAVSEIEEQLDYLEIRESIIKKTEEFINKLRDEPYDYIFIDNRSGVDEMILSSCKESDFIISISESDPIAKITNENIIRHLNAQKVGKIYTIINKVKFMKNIEDYHRNVNEVKGDVNVLGNIPFDIDLFEAFGTPRFWDNVNSTRYAHVIASAWNKVASRESLNTFIDMERFPISKIWPSYTSVPTFLTKFERLSLMMGGLFLVFYFIYDMIFFGQFNIKYIILIYSIILIMVPLLRRLMHSQIKTLDKIKFK